MPDMLWGIPILFGLFFVLVFVLVIGGIIFAIVKGIATWSWNNQQPVQTQPAHVVSKRTDTSGVGSSMNGSGGQRQEFGLSGHEYGLLAEGDPGTLTFQGTRYKGFARSSS